MKEGAEDLSASEWWGQRRARYNIGLVIAGLLAFGAYATRAFADVGITVFTTIYLIVSFLLAIGMADIFYLLAPISERLLKPGNVATYRNITYNLVFWFFVFILFISPLLVGYVVVLGGRTSA
jgi:hypothetical protein